MNVIYSLRAKLSKILLVTNFSISFAIASEEMEMCILLLKYACASVV